MVGDVEGAVARVSELVDDVVVAYVFSDEERVRHMQILSELVGMDVLLPRYGDLVRENAALFVRALGRDEAALVRELSEAVESLSSFVLEGDDD